MFTFDPFTYAYLSNNVQVPQLPAVVNYQAFQQSPVMQTCPSFHEVANAWFKIWSQNKSKNYVEQCFARLHKDFLDRFSPDVPINQITAPFILHHLRRVQDRNVSVPQRKLRSHISQIFRYAIACGYADHDPARDLSCALQPHRVRPRSTITDPDKIGELMVRIQRYRYKQRRLALRLAALSFVRAGEIVSAAWEDIDETERVWNIPAGKMKMKRPHSVPITKQILQVLRDIKALHPDNRWLFPSKYDKTQHEKSNCLTLAIRALGYTCEEFTAHGFRAMAATTLSEHGFDSILIERQLAHIDQNKVRAAYQRSPLLDDRRKMMQWWNDWLDVQQARVMLAAEQKDLDEKPSKRHKYAKV